MHEDLTVELILFLGAFNGSVFTTKIVKCNHSWNTIWSYTESNKQLTPLSEIVIKIKS